MKFWLIVAVAATVVDLPLLLMPLEQHDYVLLVVRAVLLLVAFGAAWRYALLSERREAPLREARFTVASVAVKNDGRDVHERAVLIALGLHRAWAANGSTPMRLLFAHTSVTAEQLRARLTELYGIDVGPIAPERPFGSVVSSLIRPTQEADRGR